MIPIHFHSCKTTLLRFRMEMKEKIKSTITWKKVLGSPLRRRLRHSTAPKFRVFLQIAFGERRGTLPIGKREGGFGRRREKPKAEARSNHNTRKWSQKHTRMGICAILTFPCIVRSSLLFKSIWGRGKRGEGGLWRWWGWERPKIQPLDFGGSENGRRGSL